MRSTAPTRTCALTWNVAGSATCWRWPPATRWPPRRAPAPPASSPPGCPARRGSATPPARGAKGHRYHDWAWAAIDPGRPGQRWLLIRRSRRTREPAFYRYSPRRVFLPVLVKIAGIRWATEENFQAGQDLAGLDEHQVRRWDSWYRWTTLAMLALAFLSITAATEHASCSPAADQIPLTRNEIAALFSTLTIEPARDTRHRLRWPAWRRRRQLRARACHYQRQADHEDQPRSPAGIAGRLTRGRG
jgi:hypothetical protein